MNAEILPYQRMKKFNSQYHNEKTNLIKSLFTKENLIFLPMLFLLGRASVLGGLMPFGTAMYFAYHGRSINKIAAAIAVITGMLTRRPGEQIYVTIIGMILFQFFQATINNSKSSSIRKNTLIGVTSILLPQTILVCLQGFLLYDLLRSLLFITIIFIGMIIFNSSSALIDEKDRHIKSNEQAICVAITVALIILGLSGIQVFSLAIRNILCILIILAYGYKYGPGVGAATGVTIGLIVSLSGAVTPMLIGSYAFCGLLCGMLRSIGKIGSGLGFILGNAMLTLYMNGAAEVLVYLNEIVAAVVVFMIFPGRLLAVITGNFSFDSDITYCRPGYYNRIKDMTIEKLVKFSRAFKEISLTFNEISETQVSTDKQDISALFDRVADKVCKDCSLCLHCWDRNFYNTYQVMFRIIEKLDTKGRIEEKDIPEYFLERCERINDFVGSVNNIYEVFKVDMVWKSKISESRGFVSQQLEGLSRVIYNLASEIQTDISFKSEYEKLITSELEKAGLKIKEVVVYKNKWERYEVCITHKGCGGKRSCINRMEKMVGDIVGKKMIKVKDECGSNKSGVCSVKFMEQELLKVTTGVAKIAKLNDNISGDSYTFANNGEGKYIAALSDGMGSGHKAATQSRATINLLEHLMESGFDKDTTIKLINSVLVLKSSEESFATIDMSVIDLYDGNVEFVKIGAVPTFIKTRDSVEVVRSASLPAGILSNIEVELISKNVQNGDFVIMLSDGAYDSFSKKGLTEKELADYIWEMNSVNPQQIADMIMDKAYENYDKEPEDDMMIIVAKVWKTAA